MNAVMSPSIILVTACYGCTQKELHEVSPDRLSPALSKSMISEKGFVSPFFYGIRKHNLTVCEHTLLVTVTRNALCSPTLV